MNKRILAIKLCITALFLLSFLTSSQAQTATKQKDPKDTQQGSAFSDPQQERRIQQKTSTSTTPSTINEDDIYQGRQAEILHVLTVNQIPADFPKYEKGKGIQWYNTEIDNYYRLHPEIVKELFRKKLGI